MNKNILLSLFTAFLLWLAWPPMPFTSPLLLIAFVPLLLAINNIRTGNFEKKGRKIFLLSLMAFFTWNTASIYWVFNSLNAVMPAFVAFLVSLIPFGLAAILMTLAFWLYDQTQRRYAYLSLPAMISFWIAYEYLHQSWSLHFPWMTLGNGFATMPQAIQWYEYTGVYGGSVWILCANFFAFKAMLNLQQKQPLKARFNQALIWFAIIVALPLCFSVYVYYHYEEEVNPSNIVVVQPNIDPYLKYDNAAQSFTTLLNLSKQGAKKNTEFILWPETALTGLVNEEGIRYEANYKQIQNFLSAYKNGNLLSGAETYLVYDSAKTTTAKRDDRTGRYWDSFNSAVNIENAAKVQFYHKSKLVPGVEQMPFGGLSFLKPLFAAFGGTTGGYGKQEKPGVIYAQSGIGVAPTICYESIWGDWVAGAVKDGAQFIAVLTNDGWWGNTSGKDQHLDYARLRAIENRRWVARSANTGISAFINQRGDITKQTNWWQPAVLNEDINLNSKTTFYTQHPDIIVWPFIGFAGFMLIYLLVSRKPFKK